MVSELDVIIVALPLNADSINIINKEVLDNMHKKSVLINIGRGQSVDENALYDTLKEDKILGAALDVFEVEPLDSNSPLWELENLLISPHICGGSNYMNKRMYDLVYDNLKSYINGEDLKNIVV